MYELVLVGSGFILGVCVALGLFRWGTVYATNLIYKIKENIPLEGMGKPTEQDFSG